MKKNIFKRVDDEEIFSRFNHRGLNLLPETFKNKKILVLTDVKNFNTEVLGKYKIIKTCKNIPENEIKDYIFYIYFICDSDAYIELEYITKNNGKYIPYIYYKKTSYRFVDKKAYIALQKTWGIPNLVQDSQIQVHENICEALNITKNLEGDYLEIGVFTGGSALTALNYLDLLSKKRNVWLLDTYEGFNYDTANQSSDCTWQTTHKIGNGKTDAMNNIQELLKAYDSKYKMVITDICKDSLPKNIKKIAVINIDVDLYEATLSSLEKCSEFIILGGVIICEDPTSTPGTYGSYLALQKFLNSKEGQKYTSIFKKGSYFLIKNRL